MKKTTDLITIGQLYCDPTIGGAGNWLPGWYHTETEARRRIGGSAGPLAGNWYRFVTQTIKPEEVTPEQVRSLPELRPIWDAANPGVTFPGEERLPASPQPTTPGPEKYITAGQVKVGQLHSDATGRLFDKWFFTESDARQHYRLSGNWYRFVMSEFSLKNLPNEVLQSIPTLKKFATTA